MLFTGDAMEERTQEILSEFSGTFDLIKLPHHGRETDTAALLSDTNFGTDATAYVVTSSEKGAGDIRVCKKPFPVRCIGPVTAPSPYFPTVPP